MGHSNKLSSDEAHAEAILDRGAAWLLVATWAFFLSLTITLSS